MVKPFLDRADAGRRLGAAVRLKVLQAQAVVLGLARGGVPVAAGVADALGVELDVLVVRKVGVPNQPELAMGAVAAGGVEARLPYVMRLVPDAEAQFERVATRERAEIERRERRYRCSRPPLELGGRAVVLVDDGLATGATMQAAVRFCRAGGAERIIVAVPVAAPTSLVAVTALANDVVCLLEPAGFATVGQWYQSFTQLEDDEVRRILASTRHST